MSDIQSPAAFKPNGIITLTTDFGTSEPFVGLMKGVILSRLENAKIVDLTHHIPAYQSAIAGFWLTRSWPYFPVGTVHLAVVDPGVGTTREMVLLRTGDHVFVAPDNGLLEEVARSADDLAWWQIELNKLSSFVLPNPSKTFHGRDIFAPLVAELAAGRLRPEDVGTRLEARGEGRPSTPTDAHSQVTGQIVAIDHFGNLITNLPQQATRRFLCPSIKFRDQAFVLKDTYGSVSPGEMLAVINSFGVVELALAQGNAQQHFAARQGEQVSLREA